MSSKIKVLNLIILSCLNCAVFGQTTVKQIRIKWQDLGLGKPYAFDCVYPDEQPSTAQMTEIIDLPDSFESVTVSLENIESRPADKVYNDVDISTIGQDFSFNFQAGYINKKPVVLVTINLLSSRTGQLYLLHKADIVVKHTAAKNVIINSTAVGNSILNSGNWRRVKTDDNGVYKITFEELEKWGMSQPANVRVYGTGGRLLSKRNTSDDPVYLYENPIYVETHGDGVFNQGDYILFFGHGTVKYFYDSISRRYYHIKNHYSDEGNYFITTDLGAGRRIQNENYNMLTAKYVTSSVDVTQIWDDDEQNPLASGRLKYCKLFTPYITRDVVFNFPGQIIDNEDVIVQTYSLGAQVRDEPQCSFEFKSGDINIHRSFFHGYAPNEHGVVWSTKYQFSNVKGLQNPIELSAKFYATSIAARAAIDFIRVTARLKLSLVEAKTLYFADSRNIEQGTVKQYRIEGDKLMVWNVTEPLNPKNMELVDEGAVKYWKYNNDKNQFFYAFKQSGINTVKDLGVVDNQNIQGAKTPELIIVTAPLFRNEAEKLADFRRTFSGLEVMVLEPQQIYNEFSSGIPDVSAIRNMVRHFYNRTGETKKIKYLLLIGDGSYDNKWSAATNNHLPTYQSVESLSLYVTLESDDYFGLLDPDEGGHNIYEEKRFNGFLDIGVGRLPVESVFEAQTLIDKIISYSKNPKLDSWKNELTFLADDADRPGDFNLQKYTYDIAAIMANKYPWFHNNLIFMDSHRQISTPAGQIYPTVRDAINNTIHRGTLLFNYTGHGSPNQLAHEAVIDKVMVNKWRNSEFLPFFMTASCEIARYDNHDKKSIGEMILLNPNGGAVSMFTTTRIVFMGENQSLSMRFFNRVFERNSDGNYSTLGEIMMDAKNREGAGLGDGDGSNINMRKFTLLGDPSMKLIVPPYRTITDSINGFDAQVTFDTINAMQKVKIHGSITDTLGNKISDYDGILHATVYDKIKEKQTLDNDGNGKYTYYTQDNILYRGKSTIKAGKFSFEFIVPLDINYEFGRGKISYYAQNGAVDAQGAFRSFAIGGSAAGAIVDNKGPEINIFMNDTNFVSGSSTNESPKLIVKLHDENGINTTGTGIGHEITARLKHAPNNVIVLNNHYEAELNSYQNGSINYQLLDLPDGENQITVRAWDILNNTSENILDFAVANTEKAALMHVMNYPNPFTTHTKFLFEHNQPHIPIEITIQIFTVSGKLVKTLQTTMQGSAYQTSPLTWDGLDDFGDRIGRGVYVYKVKIKTPDGKTDSKFEKLVILK